MASVKSLAGNSETFFRLQGIEVLAVLNARTNEVEGLPNPSDDILGDRRRDHTHRQS